MFISRALAAHGVVSTGSSGGGTALLIILGAAILFGVVYMLQKKLRKRMGERRESNE